MLSLLLRTIRTERLRSTTLYIKNKSHANIFTRQKNFHILTQMTVQTDRSRPFLTGTHRIYDTMTC